MISVVVHCGKEDVTLKLCPADFQFVEFDRWVRNRFDVTADQKMAFRDAKGSGTAFFAYSYATSDITHCASSLLFRAECLPTKAYFLKNTEITVELKKTVKKGINKEVLIRRHVPIAVVAIAVLVYIFRHADLVSVLAFLEAALHESGYFLKKEVMLEAMINGLGWSIMHLFIRRMLNPENEGKWFDGYFLDSCYGGLAACGQTLFKGFFLVTLLKKHQG